MSDLIDRQAAIDATWEEPTYSDPLNVLTEVRDRLKGLPSVQPEIIRCKDCKYAEPNGKYGCEVYHYKLYETHNMKADDFCSRAERRGDD